MRLGWLYPLSIAAFSAAMNRPAHSAVFGDDLAFLRQFTQIVVLTDRHRKARVAVGPAWQGRVMTSSALGDSGMSFGWINRSLIASGDVLPHFNPLGGEDRIWLGPEGGQFSIYFARGMPFDLEHWYVPKPLDTLPFEVEKKSRDRISLTSRFSLTNYSGTEFQVLLNREVRVLEPKEAWQRLAAPQAKGTSLVAYESRNTLSNAGSEVWSKETGLLSIWILGMFNPSLQCTIVIPIRAGSDAAQGTKVTSDYFGAIPSERLRVTDSAVFLKADGQLRSKVGVSPHRSLGTLGSYDAAHHVLTIVQFDQAVTDYVNSLWKIQSEPYGGDAANAYNDGPPAPGKPPMGPFFELESSSPAAALTPGASLSHTHRTIHVVGPEAELNRIAVATLGVPLGEIQDALQGKREAE